jgi:hypothetical protein
MSVDQTAAALAALSVADAALRSSLHKLHSSHQHSFLPWRHLSAAHLQQIAAAGSPGERRARLRKVLRLEERFVPGEVHVRDVSGTAEQQAASRALSSSMADPNRTRQEILLDFALNLLGFCWTNELNALKTSTFFSILYTVHQHVSEVAGPQPSARESWSFFEHQLLRHSVERPPFSIACFSQPEVVLLSGYALQTYFAQLKLYQYAFGTSNELEIQATNSVAESVSPLTLGLPLFRQDEVKDEWRLENAKNYFPTTGGSMTLPTKTHDEERESPLAAHDGLQDEFRDDVNGLACLNASASAALKDAGSAASAGGALLADPAEQALFDQAIAREMQSLYKDFGQQLARQQEVFEKRLMEIDPTAAAQQQAANGQASARGKGADQAVVSPTSAASGQRAKSRGKQ